MVLTEPRLGALVGVCVMRGLDAPDASDYLSCGRSREVRMRYVLLAVVLLAGVCLASFEVTLQPDDDEGNDSSTDEYYPDSNYGDETFFMVMGDSMYAFIEFRELDHYVGRGYTVLSAELWLTLFNDWKDTALIQTRPLSEEEIWIAPVDAAWEEMEITWNNQPGIYETYAVERSFEEPEYGEEYFVSFDVQDIVQAWLNEDIP
ncbi:MAG: DNRLRE domain-containing protein, partial [Candidatus Coatesbacteria bacterium]|nr:DNRLRE domain-containing protein [Candidatus Coatesbacteria bacterium]